MYIYIYIISAACPTARSKARRAAERRPEDAG